MSAADPLAREMFAPGRLWSLLQVLRFYGSTFAVTLAHLVKDAALLRMHPVDTGLRAALQKSIGDVLIDMKALNASRVTVTQIERLIEHGPKFQAEQLCSHCEALFNLIITEFGEDFYYRINPEDSKLLRKDSLPFGSDVQNVFPDTIEDIRASARCLVFGEANASVYHSMRVLEHGLRALAEEVGVADVALDNWKNIIDMIEARIREQEKLPKSREKSERLRHLSSAAVQFRYFKDAWRNHAAHSRAWYDALTARSIFEHVRQFMCEMATTAAPEN